MAAPQQTPHIVYTEDEYFGFAETAEERWEFLPNGLSLTNGSTLGNMRAMSGGTAYHNLIAMNIGRTLGNALVPRGCLVFGSDLRVRTGDGVNTYPDLSVVCEPLSFYQEREDTVFNPLLVVEVLSPSTRKYDLGEKFAHYQTVTSLSDYLLVFQDQAKAILHSRAEDLWETRVFSGPESAVWLPSVQVTLALADIYALVRFDTAASEVSEKI